MSWKLFCCAFICGIAALSPAPIRDLKDGEHALPRQTAEQVAAEQKYDGVVGAVGTSPSNTRDLSTAPPPPISNNVDASSALAKARIPSSQAKAAENIGTASRQLKLDGATGPSPLLVGFVVICLVATLLYAAKVVLEKVGPAPKSFNPAERMRR